MSKFTEDFEYFDDIEDEPIEEIEKPLINDLDLVRLQQCAISTKKGFIDQGFPQTMRRLASFNFVKSVGNGYKVTSEGLLYIQKYKKKLETI